MNRKLSALLLTACTGLFAITLPTVSHAGNVGYSGHCSSNATPVGSIVAAGHTPVAVNSLEAGSFAGLDALLILSCSFSANDAVNAAVANGLTLIVHDWSPHSSTGAKLPGAPAVSVLGVGGDGGDGERMDLASGSPIATGPGGALTHASLDGGTSSYHGHATLASLPASGTALTVIEGQAAKVVTFAYPYGAGRVIYGAMPLDHYLPGGTFDQLGLCATNTVCTGMQTYLTNLIAWSVGPQFTSCAAEGYRGARLNLCRQVCEIDQSPSRLTSLIKFYMAAFRSEPPCGR